ncbi:hypothetical protein [Qipengyuania zhejiangensis]|uniref:hypothetical protein n=1 Tax=Qipengyuania zhejiangensis TaxID=3077782 RepID=UPI002D78294C|nr:hypothetical protein [Qipengyuania sp. Z2]
MTITTISSKAILQSTATAIALVICGASAPAFARDIADNSAMAQHSGGSGHESDAHDSGSDHQDSGAKGQKGKGREPGTTSGRGEGKGSMEDIFRAISGEDEGDDSDRPDWAGEKGGKNERGGKPGSAGDKRGDLFGDMYVILRDANGIPILTPEGYVQPLDLDGNPIPLDAEGAPIDPTLAIEVELGRLNVGRSPNSVLDRRAQEVVNLLNDATDLSLDAAGRLVVTVDGVANTIDSPLENLAIYVALMTTGTIPGVTDLPGTEFDHLVDGVLTTADLQSATAFLAAASDKAGELTADEVAYINAFLDINTTSQGDVTYSDIDYSGFTYDRSDIYEGTMITVLIQQPDGSWVPTQVDIYEAVFADVDFSGSGSLTAFAQAAEDARAVIEYIHEYAVPVVP